MIAAAKPRMVGTDGASAGDPHLDLALAHSDVSAVKDTDSTATGFDRASVSRLPEDALGDIVPSRTVKARKKKSRADPNDPVEVYMEGVVKFKVLPADVQIEIGRKIQASLNVWRREILESPLAQKLLLNFMKGCFERYLNPEASKRKEKEAKQRAKRSIDPEKKGDEPAESEVQEHSAYTAYDLFRDITTTNVKKMWPKTLPRVLQNVATIDGILGELDPGKVKPRELRAKRSHIAALLEDVPVTLDVIELLRDTLDEVCERGQKNRALRMESLLDLRKRLERAESAHVEATHWRHKLTNHNLRLPVKYVNKTLPSLFQESIRGNPGRYLNAIQEGNEGLFYATGRYDPERGTNFSTCAVHWIKQRAKREFAEHGGPLWARPVHVAGVSEKINRVEQFLIASGIPKPDADQLKREVLRRNKNISGGNLDTAMLQRRSAVSLDQRKGHDPDGLRLGDSLPDHREEPDSSGRGADITSGLEPLFKRLNQRQRYVLAMRMGLGTYLYPEEGPPPSKKEIELETWVRPTYGKSYTLLEVGASIGVTRERVRQIEEKAVRKLREGDQSGLRALRALAADLDIVADNPQQSHEVSSREASAGDSERSIGSYVGIIGKRRCGTLKENGLSTLDDLLCTSPEVVAHFDKIDHDDLELVRKVAMQDATGHLWVDVRGLPLSERTVLALVGADLFTAWAVAQKSVEELKRMLPSADVTAVVQAVLALDSEHGKERSGEKKVMSGHHPTRRARVHNGNGVDAEKGGNVPDRRAREERVDAA